MRSSGCWWRSARPVSAVMTLALMLCAAGCISSPELNPSVHQTPLGNAVLVTLPVGTMIWLPNSETQDQVRAAFINELGPSGNGLKSIAPLKLATPAYIAERDAIELDLIRRLEPKTNP